MAIINMRGFGGMQPSANPKLLPDAAGVKVENVELRFGDMRPIPVARDTGNVMAPGRTLYRFESTGDVLTNPGDVSYVRGPIPNDTLERTYYSGDGAPKVITKFNQIRQLGVPAPQYAPVFVVNSTPQYSTDDAAADQARKLKEVTDAARLGYDSPFMGLTDADLAARFIPNRSPDALWSFCFKIPGTLTAGVFSPSNPNHVSLMDDSMGFFLDVLGDGKTYGLVNIDFRGQAIVLRSDFDSRFAAITDPSDSTGVKKLLTQDQIDTIESTLKDALVEPDAARAVITDRLRVLKDQFIAVADGGSTAAVTNVAAVKAFYQRADVQTQINAAVKQAVSAIYGAMFSYNNATYTSTPTTGGGGGGGGGGGNNPYTQQPQ